jgi:hypothetical protein
VLRNIDNQPDPIYLVCLSMHMHGPSYSFLQENQQYTCTRVEYPNASTHVV